MSPLWPGSQTESRKPRGTGQRNVPVTVEQMTESGGGGYPVETWTTLVQTYWCSKQDLRAQETFAANQETSSADTHWTGAYLAELDPDRVDVPKYRRFRWRGKTHDIVAAQVMGERAGLEFLTLAQTGARSR